MLESVVKGSGEKSAWWGFGAVAIDSVMLVGSPGTRGGYGEPRIVVGGCATGGVGAGTAAGAGAGAGAGIVVGAVGAGVAGAEAALAAVPFSCGGAGRSASAGSMTGALGAALLGDPSLGASSREVGADMALSSGWGEGEKRVRRDKCFGLVAGLSLALIGMGVVEDGQRVRV
jgi:hypothetical protein